jgi:hypothetical protein|tara:strand:+ start:156 stop:410 length:255 start_codon:yes stop_codon:yes gene_type:complete
MLWRLGLGDRLAGGSSRWQQVLAAGAGIGAPMMPEVYCEASPEVAGCGSANRPDRSKMSNRGVGGFNEAPFKVDEGLQKGWFVC